MISFNLFHLFVHSKLNLFQLNIIILKLFIKQHLYTFMNVQDLHFYTLDVLDQQCGNSIAGSYYLVVFYLQIKSTNAGKSLVKSI